MYNHTANLGAGYYKVLDLYVEAITIRCANPVMPLSSSSLARTRQAEPGSSRARTRQGEPGSNRPRRQLDEPDPSRVQSCDPVTDRQTDETHDAEERTLSEFSF